MKIELAYGSGTLSVELPEACTTVIEPGHATALLDERAAVINALDHPIAAKPLKTWIKPGAKVCITFSDMTRATPNERIIPWVLAHLSHIPRNDIILVNQLGTHRPNTRAELQRMLTPEVVANYTVVNHEPENPDELVQVGTTRDGTPALLNRHVVGADVRIITGFIEPHFFAGFSGGPKGIMPGTAGLQTVMSNHGARNIGSPQATFGITQGNPLWEELRDIALRAGPSFVLNVTLDVQRRITGVFAGDLILAHREGCAFVRQTAMQRVDAPFDIVITTNSGYPLDLNLYQSVKGLSAGARIVKPGGLLIVAAECREGVPAGSPYDTLLRSVSGLEELLAKIESPGFRYAEQWQTQILAVIQRQVEVQVYSSLPDETLRNVHLTACHDIAAAVGQRLAALGPDARIAVLPQGPLTIPYLAGKS
ncbi:MAG: nickel-dependent lactate racemase [Verrucomicrobiota bacterium]